MREKLINICTPRQWKTLSTSELKDEGYTVYGANGVIGYYSEYNHETETVMVTCRGATCGTVNISKPYSYINGNAMCMDDLRHDIDVKYLYYALKNYDFKEVISGSAQPQITRQGLNNVFVEVVDKPRQLEIVKVLSNVEETISRKQQQLTEYDQLIKSRFVEMFGDVLINDRSWPMYKWNDVLIIKNGKNQKKVENKKGKYPICGSGGVMSYADDYICNENSVIIGRKGNINNPLLMRQKYWNVDTAFGLEPHINRINVDYLYMFCTFYDFLKHNKTVTIPSLTKTDLLKIDIPTPPVRLQNEFTAFVQQVDKLKFAVQKSLDETQTLFDSLMQKYFG